MACRRGGGGGGESGGGGGGGGGEHVSREGRQHHPSICCWLHNNYNIDIPLYMNKTSLYVCMYTQPTYNDEPMLAPCNAHADLMWVSDKPKVLVEPASVSSDQLRVKLITRHGANKGEDYQREFTACVCCGEGWVDHGGDEVGGRSGSSEKSRGRHARGILSFYIR